MNSKPLVSIVIAAYNEEGIIENNLDILVNYLKGMENDYSWEIIIVNDGSKDNTGKIADNYAVKFRNILVCHHRSNKNLGSAIRTGFNRAKGDYIVTMDLDLSYAPEYIEKMISTINDTNAEVVLASPYMPGGKLINVPFLRKFLSKSLNGFLYLLTKKSLHTFTGMTRAYKSDFIKYLDLKSIYFDINTEIVYKALLLRADIVEIPAHLDWSLQNKQKLKRISNFRIIRGILSGFLSGFLFRPHMLFFVIGTLLGITSFYLLGWIFYHVITVYPDITVGTSYFDDQFANAVAVVFKNKPHSFFIAGITLILSIQFFSMGFIAIQNKRYFEELFHLNTTIYKYLLKKKNKDLF